MRTEVKITARYDAKEKASAVVRALSPDNVGVKGLKTASRGRDVETTFECESVATAHSTADDVLKAHQAAEKMFKE